MLMFGKVTFFFLFVLVLASCAGKQLPYIPTLEEQIAIEWCQKIVGVESLNIKAYYSLDDGGEALSCIQNYLTYKE